MMDSGVHAEGGMQSDAKAGEAGDGGGSRAVRRIKQLPALVANQIAAGEVVERPASVVKELVENALDAGAGQIAIELEQGGIELIRITDDGGGIEAGDLVLAISPHATSKIESAEDLVGIATKGFRGEALASITSVSRMSIRSRTVRDDAASVIEAEGSEVKGIKPAAGPVGTVVTVRNLFFNTPARRKFLRTAGTEQSRCVEVVRELAIAHPAIGMSVVVDGKRVLDLPREQTPRQRALAILGEELSEQLLEIADDGHWASAGSQSGVMSLWGLIGRPAIARSNAAGQFVALNGRIIKDRTIQHALKEAYRGLIEPGRYPMAVLLLEIDPRLVDVNVHPAKTEVRFRESSLVHSLVLNAVRDGLRRADLTGHAGDSLRGFGAGNSASGYGGSGNWSGGLGLRTGGDSVSPANAARFVEEARSAFGVKGTGPVDFDALRRVIEGRTAGPGGMPGPGGMLGPGGILAPGGMLGQGAGIGAGAGDQAGTHRAIEGNAPGDVMIDAPLARVLPAVKVLAVHNSYLVIQDESGLVIMDQHALHERVMFEKLLQRVQGAGRLESQRLLMPVVVEDRAVGLAGGRGGTVGGGAALSMGEALERCGALLDRLGIEAQSMGPRAIGVHAFCSLLFERGVEIEPFMRELLEKAARDGFEPTGEQALHEVLDMMACKAAIKAGDALSEEEMTDLINARHRVERSAACPHGRPTMVRLTIRDLEKMFHRA